MAQSTMFLTKLTVWAGIGPHRHPRQRPGALSSAGEKFRRPGKKGKIPKPRG
jgi:hypothetical protein